MPASRTSLLPGPAVDILPDETCGSLIWRTASARREAVSEFCQLRLGLSYSQARGDLDQIPESARADHVARALNVDPVIFTRLKIDRRWRVSVFNRLGAPGRDAVNICADCVTERPYGRRFWRTHFAAVCSLHQCELMKACPTCGTCLRYRSAPLGVTPLLWLETWPTCAECLTKIDRVKPPVRPHQCLLDMSVRWENALHGKPPYPWIGPNDFLSLSLRLINWFKSREEYIEARRLCSPTSPCNPHLASSLLLERLWRPNIPKDVFQAALGMPFDPAQLAYEIVS